MIQKSEIFPRVPLYYSVPMLVICIVALLILVFIFRVEYPVILLAPSNAINVSSCGVLSQDNAYYVLNQTLTTTGFFQGTQGACLLVNGSNITVDGNFYNINGTVGLAFNGINVSGINVTVTGFNISDETTSILRNGVLVYGSNNFIFNNSISNASEIAIYLASVTGTTVSFNNIRSSVFGIYSDYSSYNEITHNYISEQDNSPVSRTGIGLFLSNDSNIRLNQINYTNISVSIWGSYRNNLVGLEITKPIVSGIYLFSANETFLINININEPRRNGVTSISSPSVGYRYSIRRLTVTNGNSSHYDLDVNSPYFSSSADVNLDIAQSLFNSYSFNNTLLTYSDYLGWISSSGVLTEVYKINFTQTITTSGNNLTNHIRTGYNFAEVRSDLNPGLNNSATITFSGLPTNITNISILRNGAICPSNICVNLTNLSAGNVLFNVTGWTNYTINWTGTSVPNQPQPGTQSMSINEPDPNEQYTTAAFPVTFRVILSTLNGSVKFSFNNGATNTTMIKDSTGVEFEYVQNSLDAGNYTFLAFANFTNGTRIKDSVNFSVINTTGSSTAGPTGGSNSGGISGGSSGGSSGGTTTGATTGNGTTGGTTTGSGFGTTSGTGSTQTLTGNQSSSNIALRSMIFWLLIAVISIMIIILTILIVKAIKRRRSALSSSMSVSNPVNTSGLVSNLR